MISFLSQSWHLGRTQNLAISGLFSGISPIFLQAPVSILFSKKRGWPLLVLPSGVSLSGLFHKIGQILMTRYQQGKLPPPSEEKLESLCLDPLCLTKEGASEIFQQGLSYGQDLCFVDMIHAFSVAIALNPDCAIAYHNRGCAYFYAGDQNKAFMDFGKALHLAPDCAESYLGRGTVLVFLGDYQRAILDFDTAMPLNTNNARVYFNRATTYMALSNRNAAIADYHQARIRFSAQQDETMLRQVNHCLQLLDTNFSTKDDR
jgi:tetratricopeptide (TPR) repeat protein